MPVPKSKGPLFDKMGQEAIDFLVMIQIVNLITTL